MVWFQCEDCGENLKKPKLPNHFRFCSAYKLSCIDCGQVFSQQSVQSHTQCISEAEKYGPKGQVKASSGTPAKPKSDSKPIPDFDINVGLSLHAPWFCSLCNTHTTSQQTLLLHADGKKHRAKARAFHAKQQPQQTQEVTANEKNSTTNNSAEEPVNQNHNLTNESAERVPEAEKESRSHKKRKIAASGNGAGETKSSGCVGDLSNGEVIQAEKADPGSLPKKKKRSKAVIEDQTNDTSRAKEATDQKIKWKKLITSILKSNPDGVLKMRKLWKLASKALEESGVTLDKAQLQETLEHKISSSSRFILENKLVRLAA